MTKTREYAHGYVSPLCLVTGLFQMPRWQIKAWLTFLSTNAMNKLEKQIEQKKADLELMHKMIEDLHNTNQPVSKELLLRVENLEKEIKALEN